MNSPRARLGLRSSDHASFSTPAGGAHSHAALLQRQQELVEDGVGSGNAAHAQEDEDRALRASEEGDSRTSSMHGGARLGGGRGGLFSGKGSLLQRLARSMQGEKKGRMAALRHAEWRETRAGAQQDG